MIEKITWNQNGPMETNETDICVHVETKKADGEHLINDELKALMIRNETEEYLPFKKVDQRTLRDSECSGETY